MGIWQLRQVADQHRVDMERLARPLSPQHRPARRPVAGRLLGGLTGEGGRWASAAH